MSGYKSIGRLLPIVLFRSTTATTLEYDIVYGNLASTTSEAATQITLDYDVIVRRFRVSPTANAKTAAVTVAFRADGATVTGTSLSIPAGSIAEVSSAALSVVVRSGSKINFMIDLTGSGAGTISLVGIVMMEVVT